jgi:hypothetical protein
LEPVYPVFTDSNGRINEITIRLHNRHHPEVAPNFYLQPRFEGEPSRWRIIEGPQRVASGERVNFTIGPVSESGGFYVGARIIVLDPTGHFLGSLVLGDYQDYSFPDNVFNSRFHLWTRGASAPDGWRFDAAPRNRGGAFMTMVDEKSAIALQIEPSDGPTLSALQSTISFPYRPFDLLVKHNGLPDSATFGVEFSDGIHRIVFDFAASVPDIHMAANNFREQRPVPAGTWSVETIDLTAVYAAAGWELPELKYTVYRELELDWRLLDMRLLLASRTSQPVVGYFGGIRQPLERIAPGLLISESLEDRLSTFRRIAAIHRMMRNDHLALITLEGALLQFPHNTELLAEVESLRDTITRSTSQEIP